MHLYSYVLPKSLDPSPSASQAHRLLLAMSSPVFEAMLYGPLAEGDELVLPDDPPEAFEWLLNHLYMNDTQLPHAGLTTKVYMLASKYQLDNVCKICSKAILCFFLYSVVFR